MIFTSMREKGQTAEKIAEGYLRKQKLTFVTRNFNCKQGEIDLIFLDGETVVFVEVRHRTNNAYGSALATVTLPKQTKIIKAASIFLLKKGWYNKKTTRFDIIAMNGPLSDDIQIDWIKQAFYAG